MPGTITNFKFTSTKIIQFLLLTFFAVGISVAILGLLLPIFPLVVTMASLVLSLGWAVIFVVAYSETIIGLFRNSKASADTSNVNNKNNSSTNNTTNNSIKDNANPDAISSNGSPFNLTKSKDNSNTTLDNQPSNETVKRQTSNSGQGNAPTNNTAISNNSDTNQVDSNVNNKDNSSTNNTTNNSSLCISSSSQTITSSLSSIISNPNNKGAVNIPKDEKNTEHNESDGTKAYILKNPQLKVIIYKLINDLKSNDVSENYSNTKMKFKNHGYLSVYTKDPLINRSLLKQYAEQARENFMKNRVNGNSNQNHELLTKQDVWDGISYIKGEPLNILAGRICDKINDPACYKRCENKIDALEKQKNDPIICGQLLDGSKDKYIIELCYTPSPEEIKLYEKLDIEYLEQLYTGNRLEKEQPGVYYLFKETAYDGNQLNIDIAAWWEKLLNFDKDDPRRPYRLLEEAEHLKKQPSAEKPIWLITYIEGLKKSIFETNYDKYV